MTSLTLLLYCHLPRSYDVTYPVGMVSLGPIVAVGTTSTRVLETLYWLGVKTLIAREMGPKTPREQDISEMVAEGGAGLAVLGTACCVLVNT